MPRDYYCKGYWMLKATKSHYQYFCKQVNHWIRVFGLLEWRIFFEYSEEYSGDILAECSWDYEAKTALFRFYSDWTQATLDNDHIDEIAFHEVCELLLNRVNDLLTPYYSDRVSTAELHHIIHILSNVILPQNKKD